MAEHWQTLLAVDSEPSAVNCYRANFPGVDVRQAAVADVLAEIPPCDLIEGGPPCQSFSLAGKGLGEEDERDGIPDFTAAVARVKPRAFLMENVKGLLSEKHWPYFSRVFRALGDAGYVVQYRLLDAVNFGVPQFRERVWLWGVRSDLYRDGIRHAWPVPTHAWPPPEPCMFGASLLPGVTVGQALGIDGYLRAERGKGMCERHGERRDIPTTEPAPVISAGSAGSGSRYQFVSYDHGVADPAAPSPTIKAGGNVDAGGKQGGGCPSVLRVIGGGYNPPAGRSDLRTVRDITDEPSTTISVAGGNALPEVHAYRWSDEMLAKHPPASPASPAPTVQAKWFKGGAEGLLLVEDSHEPSYRKTLWALREAIGEEAFQQWGLGLTESSAGQEVLRPQVHGDCVTWTQGRLLHGLPLRGAENMPTRSLLAMREAGRNRRPPPQSKLEGQLTEQLGAFVSLLSREGPQAEIAMQHLREASEGVPVLPKAPPKIPKVRKPTDGEKGQAPSRYCRVRRLTFWECARLQSVPDSYVWPEGITKTAAYRVVGNGQACEMARVLGDAIRAADPDIRTGVSLFCGGGLGSCGFAGRSWRYEAGPRKEGAA